MSKTKITCPKCGAELTVPENSHASVGFVLGNCAQLGVALQSFAGECYNVCCHDRQPIPSSKNMKAEEKIEALRKAGVNVDNLFSVKGAVGQATIVRLENGQLSVVPDDDPVFNAILNGDTVSNPRLFRRWVMAQMFHMLATGNFIQALQRKGYPYQWKMLAEELEAQMKMWTRGDYESYTERNRYFNQGRIVDIAQDYIVNLNEHLKTLKPKHCKGIPYIRLKGKNIFCVDVQPKVIAPLKLAVARLASAKTPVELYNRFMDFYKLAKKTWLDYNTTMASEFKDAYKGAGAYFTMKNMILFHGAKFRAANGRFLSQKQSLAVLEEKAEEYKTEGWRLFGVMKQLITDSGIDIEKKIAEWRK